MSGRRTVYGRVRGGRGVAPPASFRPPDGYTLRSPVALHSGRDLLRQDGLGWEGPGSG